MTASMSGEIEFCALSRGEPTMLIAVSVDFAERDVPENEHILLKKNSPTFSTTLPRVVFF